MEDTSFLPLLLLFLFWVIRAASKNKKKAAGKTQARQQAKASFRTDAADRAPAGRTAPAQEISSSMDARMAREFPHLFRGSMPAAPASGSLGPAASEGIDPCHDDYGSIPSGSLRVSAKEGTDPCHDDYASIPTGSLRVSAEEGTDPCHDGWEPPAEADEHAEAGAGLNLSWAGSDIVKGFIYGEILNRKVG